MTWPIKRQQVDARVHAFDGAVAEVLGGVADLGEAAADLVGAADRLAVAGDQRLGLERDDAIDGVEVERCALRYLSPRERVQVGHVAEQGAHEVAGEDGPLVGRARPPASRWSRRPGVEYSSKRRPPSVNA